MSLYQLFKSKLTFDNIFCLNVLAILPAIIYQETGLTIWLNILAVIIGASFVLWGVYALKWIRHGVSDGKKTVAILLFDGYMLYQIITIYAKSTCL